MAAELGGSQISALLESVPGIANVLRSPVADAIVNMIRAAAGVGPFSAHDAEELVHYAVRRGLIGAAEGDEVLADIRAGARGRRRAAKGARKTPARRTAPKKTAVKRSAPKKKSTAKKVVKKKAPRRPAKRR